jgi:hypothetical protein
MSISSSVKEQASIATVVTDSARRVVSALQWYSDNQENPTKKFTVESPAVLGALLKAQKIHRMSIDATKIRDPHSKLQTDVMSEEEYHRAHVTIMNKFEWLDLQLSWTTCDQTYVRYSSWSKFELADIRLDRAHGPQQDTGPGNKAMISLVLCPGNVHKDRFKYTKVVGMYHHSKPFRCATGALAMSLMVCSSRYDPRISRMTLYKNTKGGANWWEIPLCFKSGMNTTLAQAAFKAVYQEADIQ